MIRFKLLSPATSGWTVRVILAAVCLTPFDWAVGQAIELDSPPAPTILPAETIAYLRVSDAKRFVQELNDTGLGRMLNDPGLEPIREAWTAELTRQVDEQLKPLGVDAAELWTLTRGQFAIAVTRGTAAETPTIDENREEPADGAQQPAAVSGAQQRRLDNPFAPVLILGVDPAPGGVDAVIEKVDQTMRQTGWVVRNVIAGDIEVTRYSRSGGGWTLEWFRRGPTLVIGVGVDSAVQVALRMSPVDDPDVTALSSNPGFGAVMTRSVAGADRLPGVAFFVNPAVLVRQILSRSPVGGFAIPVLEDLGLDRVRGLGGVVFTGDERTESSTHLHLVVETPRTGIWGVLQPTEVPVMPPAWMPATAVGFASLRWDAAVAYDNLIGVVEKFAGVGQFATFVETPVQDRLGVDLRTDLIAQWTGRYATLQINRPGEHRRTLRRVHGFELRDPAAFDDVLGRIDEHMPDAQMTADREGETTIYKGPAREARRGQPATQPCLARIGDWLVLADQIGVMQTLLATAAGEADSIAMDLDYELAVAALGEKLESRRPFWVSYSRDADWYEAVYQALTKISGQSAYGRAIAENPPPPFESLRRYLGVSGSVGVDTDDGLQWIGATLRP